MAYALLYCNVDVDMYVSITLCMPSNIDTFMVGMTLETFL